MNYAEHASIKRTGPVIRSGALALVLVMGLAPGIARAEDDDDSGLFSLDKKIIYEVLRSFSLTPKRTLEDQFEYRERPPLVVPPSRALPPPQTAAAAARDPNWPVEAATTRQAAEKRKASRPALDPEDLANPVRPSELGPAATGAAAAAASNRSAGDGEMTDQLRPSQLGSSGFFDSLFGGGNNSRPEQQPQQQVGALAAEPRRTRLIDPPAGYQTPSPDQPYGGAGLPANSAKPMRHDDPLSE